MVDWNHKLILALRDVGWTDITREVRSYKRQDNGTVYVTFFNGKSYNYGRDKLRISESGIQIEALLIHTPDQILTGFSSAFVFEEFDCLRVIVNGKSSLYRLSQCCIERNLISSSATVSLLSYYREAVSLAEGRKGVEILSPQFDNLSAVSDCSVLGKILQHKRMSTEPETIEPIFPFGVNNSQYQAVKNALSEELSLIEGPPGTGKTQTVLNIIANLVVRGKTVAVSSNNNSALDNVYEKLEKYGYSNIAAKLGNVGNIDLFFDADKPQTATEIKTSRYTKEEYEAALKRKLKQAELLKTKSMLEEELVLLRKEMDRFFLRTGIKSENDYSFSGKLSSSSAIMNLIVKIGEGKELKNNFITRIKFFFLHSLSTSFFKSNFQNLYSILNASYYQALEKEKETELEILNTKIDDYDEKLYESVIAEYSNYLFQKAVFQKENDNGDDSFNRRNFRRRFSDFVKRYPVVLSSTYSLIRTSGESHLFDVLIIDEASQVNMASAILSLSKARTLVLSGDSMQLGQIDDESIADEDAALRKKYSIPNGLEYYGNNILKAMKTHSPDAPHVLLREHYRCQRDIIRFSNERFYNGNLVCLTPDDESENHLRLIVTAPGNHARRNPDGPGLYNEREIDEAERIIRGMEADSIAFISPFRSQAERMAERRENRVEADTIHRFQGREADEVVFSTVINDFGANAISSFVNDENLLNVAMTRARHHFDLVVSEGVYRNARGCLGDLIAYMKYECDAEVEKGFVKSVFDILYSAYGNQLYELMKKSKKGEYPTEILISRCLGELLKEPAFSSLSFSSHVRLKDALTLDKTLFDEAELMYLNNDWTHLDFVVFNRYSHAPVLFVEVDGVSYHEQNGKQRAHDQIKDRALKASGIRFVRLRTNESREEERLRALLNLAIGVEIRA